MQLCVSRQDYVLDVCVLKKSIYGVISHQLSSAISVCLTPKLVVDCAGAAG